MFLRQLATVKRVSSIDPIPGKDRIELAHIDGWQVIVKKGEFSPGDLCVYCEIDSVLPERPEFEFLRPKKFRIKTMKMGGVLSQGICFPLSVLPLDAGLYGEGDDVTKTLGVTKYEPYADEPVREAKQTRWPKWLTRYAWFRKLFFKTKRQRAGFPDFVSKTDETRIQNMPEILNDTGVWTATEKMDGQSGTFALLRHKSKVPFFPDRFEFIVCSRNLRLFTPDNSSYWRVAKKYHIEPFLKTIIGKDQWVAIQGECCGPKIQGNKYDFDDYRLFVFNVIRPSGRLPSVEASSVCEKGSIPFVPFLRIGMTLPGTVDEVLAFAHGPSMFGKTLREGVVFRSSDGRRSFKAVDPEFLLQYDE